jgi:hypothetical protein
MRLDVFFFHHPGQYWRGTVTVPSCCVLPLLANAEILPQARQGSYFFNRIGRLLPIMTG